MIIYSDVQNKVLADRKYEELVNAMTSKKENDVIAFLEKNPELDIEKINIQLPPPHNSIVSFPTLCVMNGKEGNVVLKYLLEKKKINPNHVSTENQAKFNLLMTAISFENLDAVKILLSQPELNLNYINGFGEAALHSAVRQKSSEFLKLLLERNCDMDVGAKVTPLVIAVIRKNIPAIELMIKHNVNVDFVSPTQTKKAIEGIKDNDPISEKIKELLKSASLKASEKQSINATSVPTKQTEEIKIIAEQGPQIPIQQIPIQQQPAEPAILTPPAQKQLEPAPEKLTEADRAETQRELVQTLIEQQNSSSYSYSTLNLKSLIDKADIESFKKIIKNAPSDAFKFTIDWREILPYALKSGKFEFAEVLYSRQEIGSRPGMQDIIQGYVMTGIKDLCKTNPKLLPELFDALTRYPLLGPELEKQRSNVEILREISIVADDDTLKKILDKYPNFISEKNYFGLFSLLHKASMVPVLLQNKNVMESISSWSPFVIGGLINEGPIGIPILRELLKSKEFQEKFQTFLKTSHYDFMQFALMTYNVEFAKMLIERGHFESKFEYPPTAVAGLITALLNGGDANLQTLKAISGFESVKKVFLDMPDEIREKCFKWAISTNNPGIIQFMQDMGIDFTKLKMDVNAVPEKTGDDTSLLYNAITSGNIELVKLVLRLGADPALPDNKGYSPLEIARTLGYRDIIALMKEKEAEFAKENPKKYAEYQSFCHQCKRVITAGHVLGLGKSILVTHPVGKKVEVATTGSVPLRSIEIINDSIKQYILKKSIDRGDEKYFHELRRALNTEEEFLKYEDNKALDEMLRCLNSKPRKLTFIPTVWDEVVEGQTGGHGVGIGVCGDLIFITDRAGLRGEPGEIVGTRMFKLKDGVVFTKEMIESFKPIGARPKREQILSLLKELTDEQYHRFDIETSSQNRGNCSLANPKSNIEPAFFALELYAAGEDTVKKFFDTLYNGKRVDENEQQYESRKLSETLAGPRKGLSVDRMSGFQYLEISSILQDATRNFKSITQFMRDIEIRQEIDFHKSTPDKQVSRTILSQYITHHHGEKSSKSRQRSHKSSSKFNELVRIDKILSALPRDERQALVEEIDKYSREQSGRSAILELANNLDAMKLYNTNDLIGASFISKLKQEEQEKTSTPKR